MSTISQDKKKKGGYKIKLDAKFWTRLLLLLLTVSMLASTFYYIIVFTLAASRAEAAEPTPEEDINVRIALIYDTSVTVDFLTVADNGFILGYNDGDNNFTEVIKTSITSLNIICDRSVKKSGNNYILAGTSAPDIGAYHIRIKCLNNDDISFLQTVKDAFSDVNVFPAMYDGTSCIMIGQFAAKKDAESFAAKLSETFRKAPVTETETDTAEALPDISVSDTVDTLETESATETESETGTSTDTDTAPDTESSTETEPLPEEPVDDRIIVSDSFYDSLMTYDVVGAGNTAVKAVDPSSNNIIFIFDDSSKANSLGVRAQKPSSDSDTYIYGYKGTTKYKYDGVLECFIHEDGDVYGVSVVNVLPLETYITGVIPYEIGNTWPKETIKAFAIAVRSYAIANLGRHKNSYKSDLCCTANCQVYKGFGSTNSKVRQAAQETKGVIAIHNNKICSTFYSSSTGGCTVNVSQVWGSSQKAYGYLYARATPWERYDYHSRGSWTDEATGKELYDRLIAKGYKNLKGNVTKIEIVKLADNSSYVYSVKLSDAKGNTQTISRVDKVKSLFSPWVYSGNFVVAKAGEQVNRQSYTMLGFGGVNTDETEGITVNTNPYTYDIFGRGQFSVITADGIKTFYDGISELVATGSGRHELNMSIALDSQYYPTIEGVNGEQLPDILHIAPIEFTETLTAEGTNGKFVFIGRGWGHGVGLSQWGIKDLGDLGYDYETIFKSYYSNVELVQFKDFLSK